MRRRGLSTAQAGTLAMAWMSMCAMAAVASPTLFAMVSAAAFRQSAKSAHSKQLKDEWKVVLSPLLACLLSVSIVADATDCTHSTHCNDYADCTRGCPATAFPTAQMVDGRNGGSRSCREESRDIRRTAVDETAPTSTRNPAPRGAEAARMKAMVEELQEEVRMLRREGLAKDEAFNKLNQLLAAQQRARDASTDSLWTRAVVALCVLVVIIAWIVTRG